MRKTHRQTLYEIHGPGLDPDAASKILALDWLRLFDNSTKPILLRLCETDDDSFLRELLEENLIDKRYVCEACAEIYFLTHKGQTELAERLDDLAS